MTKMPTEILRGISDAYRLSADKALEAIEDLEVEILREFADEINEIADKLDETRELIDYAVEAREGGVPKEERDEAREAALEMIGELVDKIESIEIPEAFDRLGLNHVTREAPNG